MSETYSEVPMVELFVLKDSGGVVHLLGRAPWTTLCGLAVLGNWGIAYTGELDETVTCGLCLMEAGALLP